jgi:hypothetical protein
MPWTNPSLRQLIKVDAETPTGVGYRQVRLRFVTCTETLVRAQPQSVIRSGVALAAIRYATGGRRTNVRPINRQLGLRWIPGRFIAAFTDSDPRTLLACLLVTTFLCLPVYMLHQLRRNLREAIKQLDHHTALLESQTAELRDSVCVVNLTNRNLASLMTDHSSSEIARSRLISYEEFPHWLRTRIVGD